MASANDRGTLTQTSSSGKPQLNELQPGSAGLKPKKQLQKFYDAVLDK